MQTFKPMSVKGALLIKYQQCQTCDKKTEVFFTDTVDAIFDDLRSQMNGFLAHCYIKRMQAAHFSFLNVMNLPLPFKKTFQKIILCCNKMKLKLRTGLTNKLLFSLLMLGFVKE